MSVARGEFVAVVGPTGCGKSTTLSMITGLLKPTTGEVRVMGAPVDGIDPRIGFVFQEPTLMPWTTVFNNVLLPLKLKGVARDAARARVLATLDRVGLQNFAQA